jgi:hypothetical protein
MERRNRTRALVSLIVVAALTGAAWGQIREAEGEAALYEAFVAGLDRELGGEILRAAQRGAGLTEGEPTVCATLAGTGGNPRMDGGGGNPHMDGGGTALAPFPHPTSPLWPYLGGQGHQVAVGDAGVVDPPGRPMAVIDAFDLDRTGLASLVGFQALDVHDLWALLIDPFLVDAPVEESPVPHGHLVLYHLLALWAASGTVEVGFDPGWGHPVLDVLVQGAGDAVAVHLLAIIYSDFDTIHTAMQAVRRLEEVVVVTSWGLVDCTLAAGYRDDEGAGRSAPATFAEYVAEGLQASGEKMMLLEMLCEAFEVEIASAMQIDPSDVECTDAAFLATIDGLLTIAVLADVDARACRPIDWPDRVQAGANVVFASAGNQGLPFPMPPAAWPGVVGVEACVSGAVSLRAAFSNAGGHLGQPTARALGAWFSTPAHGSDGTPLGYWGTSFAAPAAAAAFAGASWSLGQFEVFDPCQE